jgi:hypothetical protein
MFVFFPFLFEVLYENETYTPGHGSTVAYIRQQKHHLRNEQYASR